MTQDTWQATNPADAFPDVCPRCEEDPCVCGERQKVQVAQAVINEVVQATEEVPF